MEVSMEYNNSDNNKTKTDNSVKNFHTELETNDVPLNEIQSIPTQLELVQQDNQFCKYCGTKKNPILIIAQTAVDLRKMRILLIV